VITFKNRRPGPQLIDIDKPELLLPSIERALARPADLMDAVRHVRRLDSSVSRRPFQRARARRRRSFHRRWRAQSRVRSRATGGAN
jgi:hypothetical protein